MPIKFRCKYCNQLMGIARRKAGTDVNCPTCNGLLRVPFQDEPLAPAPAAGAPAPAIAPPQPVFERSDFEAYLQADAPHQPGLAAPPLPAAAAALPGTVWAPPQTNAVNVEPASLPPAVPPPGIVLSNGLATLLTIAIIFLMALSFALGLVVGRWGL
jgi:phage FluMu protein Com